MNGWTLTRVYNIDGKLVVADSIEKAIELFRKYVNNDLYEIQDIRLVTNGNLNGDTQALIKEE